MSKHRLERLEKRLAPDEIEPIKIMVSPANGNEYTHATIKHDRIDREQTEPMQAFIERVRRIAIDRREITLVIA